MPGSDRKNRRRLSRSRSRSPGRKRRSRTHSRSPRRRHKDRSSSPANRTRENVVAKKKTVDREEEKRSKR